MKITVLGEPGPQGSKTRTRFGMIESSKKVKPWRVAVEQAVMLDHPFGGPSRVTSPILFRGPVAVEIRFYLPRPKSAKAGARPSTRPDIDKLCRSTFDALKTAGVYEDDGRVVSLHTTKHYAGGAEALALPGAIIFIEKAVL